MERKQLHHLLEGRVREEGDGETDATHHLLKGITGQEGDVVECHFLVPFTPETPLSVVPPGPRRERVSGSSSDHSLLIRPVLRSRSVHVGSSPCDL